MKCPNCECEAEEIQITDNGPMCEVCNQPPEYDQDWEYQDDGWGEVYKANDEYFDALEVCEICEEYYHPDYGSCCKSES
jgi:hypothetical protein